MLSIRAGYFSVYPEMLVAEVEKICEDFAANPPAGAFDVILEQQRYELTDAQWDTANKIFTATMWKVRENNLPSKFVEGKAVQVGADLGESASFAYVPARKEALIQYNHHGPRHGVLAGFLNQMGVPGGVAIQPVLVTDAIQRVQKASVVRRLEFALGDVSDEKYLRDAGLGWVLDGMKTKGATAIRVELSLGHKKGGLLRDTKDLGLKLMEAVSGVKTVKIGVKENDDKAVEMLDLLGGRLFIDLNIEEAGRELDRQKCRERLRLALKDRQVTSEEGDDEPEDESTAAA